MSQPPLPSYAPGDRPPGRSAVILEVLTIGKWRENTRYRVRNLCCGYEQTISHKGLQARERGDSDRCPRCSKPGYRKHRRPPPEKAPAFPEPPAWPVPPSLGGRSVYRLARF